jgi:hypothetical protein
MLKILDNKDKIPYTKKIGEQLYNLWRVRVDFVWPRLAMRTPTQLPARPSWKRKDARGVVC